MLKQIKYKNSNWIDILNPSEKEISFLKENFNLHPVILEELKHPSSRSYVEHLNGVLYFVYHSPRFETKIETSIPSEIDFLITKNTLITVSYQKNEILEEIFSICETNPAAKHFYFSKGAGFLLYQIIKKCINFSLRQLTHIQEKIQDVEKKMFSGKEEMVVKDISKLKRDVLNFQLISRPHQTLLESLFKEGEKFFGKKYKVYFLDLKECHQHLWNILFNCREVIEALEITNDNIIDIRLNEIMKIFSVLAFVTFPLMLFTSMFGMNTKNAPIIGNKYDFWIIVTIMSGLTLLMFLVFKRKKWI